jgi:HK97 family phage major capsid protein
MQSKTLRQERAKLVLDARALINKESATAEDQAKCDEMLVKAEALKAQIDRIERAEAMEAELAATRQAQAAENPDAPSADQAADIAARERRIIVAYLRGAMQTLPDADRAHFAQRFNATAMNTGSGAAGGYTIAPEFAAELLIVMKLQGGVRAVARNIKTATGATLPWPTMDDTAQVATIINENTQITEDTELTFGQVSIGAFTYKSGVLLISLQLLQDSAFDFDTVIRDAIAGRFVRGQNAHFTNGTGTGQPQGVVTAAVSGKVGTTGQTTSVITDDLVDLEHSVDPVYRRGASYMMNDSSFKVLKKLKDTMGRPLFLPGFTVGSFDTILGYPVVVNQDMANMAANAKSILFGNFNNYLIRDTLEIQMMVLRERYADYLQVGYIAFSRADGKLISASTPIKYYANSAT